jgi:hypothetical protein
MDIITMRWYQLCSSLHLTLPILTAAATATAMPVMKTGLGISVVFIHFF